MHGPRRLALESSLHLPYVRWRRGAFGSLVAATTVVGAWSMVGIASHGGLTALEIGILLLFTATFGWISIAFWNAAVGFVLSVLRRDPLTLGPRPLDGTADGHIASRVALVMPIHNENPTRVMGGIAAMVRSLESTGRGDRFDVHVLSDTTDEAIARSEDGAWRALTPLLEGQVGLHFRRRAANVGRKAGNIAEFCSRCRGRYDAMIVLDADSVMTGAAMIALVRTLEAHPSVGLIQTVPIPVGRDALFGRVVQFGASLYSRMLATGQSFWQADAANYWGHNAIVRGAAFDDYCRLPVLPGRPPLGGAVLSHDFVEAALLRRAGWDTILLADLDGSFEEVPDNIVDYARRDRRWCQGSLQHLRLLGARGFHPLSRVHFTLGAMSYVGSVLWLGTLLASTAYVLVPGLSANPIVGGVVAVRDVVPLLAMTAALLFVPKVLGMLLAWRRGAAPYGGRARLVASAILEALFAVVLAPVMAMYHARFVGSVLIGRDIAWRAHPREGRLVAWTEACRSAAGITIVGLAWAGLTLYLSPTFFLWLSPIFVGLTLSAPLVRWSSSGALGRWARGWGLFLVPSETAPPPELQTPSGARAANPVPRLASSTARARPGSWFPRPRPEPDRSPCR